MWRTANSQTLSEPKKHQELRDELLVAGLEVETVKSLALPDGNKSAVTNVSMPNIPGG